MNETGSTKSVATPGPVWLEVSGFKSHLDATRIEFRPLTLLCGANSSGKSSVMQPLLMMKQTLDALPFDTSPLRLEGPNVTFTDAAQFLSRVTSPPSSRMVIAVGVGADESVRLEFVRHERSLALASTTYVVAGREVTLLADAKAPADVFVSPIPHGPSMDVVRVGCFLAVMGQGVPANPTIPMAMAPLISTLARLIHLAGHRGVPERSYPNATVVERQPGLFHERTAAVIAHWMATKDQSRLQALDAALQALGLAPAARARELNATQVEIFLGRTEGGDPDDVVSLADVGFGVSQTLPVVVGLVAAEPGQMVYVEQPEIHLHPRAQRAMADLIASTVRRGVNVVVETHSEIMLTRMQWQVARSEERLLPEDVIVHWFSRDSGSGATTVSSYQPDEAGAMGDWPEDFSAVAAAVDREYVEAAYARLPEESA